MTLESANKAIEAYCEALETAGVETVRRLLELCAADIEFKDPFNHTHSRDGYERVLRHMFKQVRNLRFQVHWKRGEGRDWVIGWTFSGEVNVIGRINVDGLSEISFDDDLKVVRHIDHWDAWASIYCRIPVLGALFRLMSRPMRI